jgi:hypothetical protein
MRPAGPGRRPGHGTAFRSLGRTGTGAGGPVPALRVSPAGAVFACGEPCPGEVAAAPIVPRGDTLAARHRQRRGFAGHREKQEAGLAPDRSGPAPHAGRAPHLPSRASGRPRRTEHLIWPAIKRGGGHSHRTKKWPPAHCGREATCVWPVPVGAAGRNQRIRTSCVSPVLLSLIRTSRPALI